MTLRKHARKSELPEPVKPIIIKKPVLEVSEPPSPVFKRTTALKPEIHENINKLHTEVNSQRQSFENFKDLIGKGSKSGRSSPRNGTISALSKTSNHQTLISRQTERN